MATDDDVQEAIDALETHECPHGCGYEGHSEAARNGHLAKCPKRPRLGE